jgi:endonuclease-3 related protein
MDALRRVGALAPSPLVAATPEQLEQWIRPTGYYRQKADRLRRLARWWLECLGPDPFAQPDGKTATSDLREALLKLKGVGPETADSILLYAFARPEFVVDAYTARLAVRLGLMSPPFGYDELKECFTSRLPRDTALYNRLHAQIVLHAKDRCRKLSPLCPDCPLKEFCRGPEADTE